MPCELIEHRTCGRDPHLSRGRHFRSQPVPSLPDGVRNRCTVGVASVFSGGDGAGVDAVVDHVEFLDRQHVDVAAVFVGQVEAFFTADRDTKFVRRIGGQPSEP